MAFIIDDILPVEVLFYLGATTEPTIDIDNLTTEITFNSTLNYDLNNINAQLVIAERKIQEYKDQYTDENPMSEDMTEVILWLEQKIENLKEYRNTVQ